MLSRKHFALIYMKLSKHYHREWDRDAEQAQYEGLQDRLGDDQLDDAYRHLLATSSSKDFMPRTEEFIHAANAAWSSRCNAASGDKCGACDSQGYVNMVAVQAHYDLGEERTSLMHWFPAHLIWDDTQLLGWSQPVGWSIWTTACVCDCEAGQRKIRSAERANADAKGDPRPVPKPHKHYTGETAQPGSYLAAQDLKKRNRAGTDEAVGACGRWFAIFRSLRAPGPGGTRPAHDHAGRRISQASKGFGRKRRHRADIVQAYQR